MKSEEIATEKLRKRSHLIPEAEIERLKRAVDLLALVRSYGVVLKAVGNDFLGKCPFHEDKHASLAITPEKNLWHCMGACNMGGTPIDWVMRVEKVGFRHAVEILRERMGLGASAGTSADTATPGGTDTPTSTATPTGTATSVGTEIPAAEGKTKAGKTRLASPVALTADDQALLPAGGKLLPCHVAEDHARLGLSSLAWHHG